MISQMTTRILNPQARMLAMLPTEFWKPARGMPHNGLTPTGADVAFAELPTRRAGALCWSYFVCEWEDTDDRKWTDLAIKEIAPRVRRGFLAKRFEIPKTGHRLRVDWEVAKTDRLNENRQNKVVLVVVPDVLVVVGLRHRLRRDWWAVESELISGKRNKSSHGTRDEVPC
jgi:hypothetical protein